MSRRTPAYSLALISLVAVLGWTSLASGVTVTAVGKGDAAPVPGAVESDAALEGAEPQGNGPTRILVGIVVDAREVATEEVYREGSEFLLPIARFAAWTGAKVEPRGGGWRLETSLGSVDLPPEALATAAGSVCLRSGYLTSKLAVRVAYDPAELSLKLDVPWRAEAELGPRPAAIAPDVRAPRSSLATIREDASYIKEAGDTSTVTSTLLGGRLLGGAWRARYEDDLTGGRSLQDYIWTRTWDRTSVLLGRQIVQLHPLLSGVDLTGAQAVWTSQPPQVAGGSLDRGELVSRGAQPLATFDGAGPPGGMAELRVDGIPVAHQSIGLDGRWEFLDVPLAARRLSRVEILVYDRANLLVPIAIERREVNLNENVLPAGAFLHAAGAGVGGNAADDLFASTPYGRRDLAGFYQFRYGLSSRLTVEGAAERVGGQNQALAGFGLRLSDTTVASAAVASGNGKPGAYADFDMEESSWRLLARGLWQDRGFSGDGTDEQQIGYAEATYRGFKGLEFGLVASRQVIAGESTRFVGPAAYWQATRNLWLRAWPDVTGQYRADAFYQIAPWTRLTVSHQDDWLADLTSYLDDRTRISFGAEAGGNVETRVSALLNLTGIGRWAPDVTLGAVVAGGRPGVVVGGSLPLTPGLLMRLDYESVPLSLPRGAPRGGRLFLGATADLTMAGRRLMPAAGAGYGTNRGAIAGRIVVAGAGQRRSYDLANQVVTVGGSVSAHTGAGGSFFIPNLAPGVYRVELDPENLPIELMPSSRPLAVEVAPGAVTRADLVVTPTYGIAGRVTDAGGIAVRGVSVELVDEHGRSLAGDTTDRFGLFRIDGVTPGTYTLRAAVSGRTVSRPVQVTNDFLFGQDLRLPVVGPVPDGGAGSP